MDNDLELISRSLIELWSAKQNTPEYDEKFWAWQAANDLVCSTPNQAWNIVLRVLELTDSEFIIDCLGADLIEHLMCEHDELTMQLITLEIPIGEKLALCMSTVRLRISDTSLYKDFYALIGSEPPFGDEP